MARESARPGAAELAAVRQLAENVPALWHAPSTTQKDRQAITRLVLKRVVVRLEGASN